MKFASLVVAALMASVDAKKSEKKETCPDVVLDKPPSKKNVYVVVDFKHYLVCEDDAVAQTFCGCQRFVGFDLTRLCTSVVTIGRSLEVFVSLRARGPHWKVHWIQDWLGTHGYPCHWCHWLC